MLLPAAIFTPHRMEVAAPVAHQKHCNQPENHLLDNAQRLLLPW
jgi:hypothetical protein